MWVRPLHFFSRHATIITNTVFRSLAGYTHILFRGGVQFPTGGDGTRFFGIAGRSP